MSANATQTCPACGSVGGRRRDQGTRAECARDGCRVRWFRAGEGE